MSDATKAMAHSYDADLGRVTDQDREYAKDIMDEISNNMSSIDDVAQWLRKVRYEAVIADRALTAAKSEWQPIETAPKDGTRFWGLIEDDAVAMFWHPKFNAFVSSYHRMTMAPGYTINGNASEDHSPTIHEPDFWRPLLEPPK